MKPVLSLFCVALLSALVLGCASTGNVRPTHEVAPGAVTAAPCCTGCACAETCRDCAAGDCEPCRAGECVACAAAGCGCCSLPS